jgi:translocation and assembly module TamA
MSRPSRCFATLVLGVCVALTTACQEEGEEGAIRVGRLEFEGNQAFDDGVLKDAMATQATGWLPWARPEYFNREEFEEDLDRLRAFYADRGYPSATIEAVNVDLNETRTEVRLRVRIEEGAPRLVEALQFTGFEGVPDDVEEAAHGSVPLKEGEPLDRRLLLASREQTGFLLRDRGYPAARVDVREEAGSADDRVRIVVDATPGVRADFGELSMVGLDEIDRATVQRTLAFRPGDLYRESLVLESQRRLVALGMLDFAHVAPSAAEQPEPGEAADADLETAAAAAGPVDSPRPDGPADNGPSRISPAPGASDSDAIAAAVAASPGTGVPMTITVVEGDPTKLRVGLGYGSEDGPRGSLNWQHTNFLGQARRLSFDGKYSLRLREASVDLLQPYVLARAVSVRARAAASWATEPNYTARRAGGRGAIEYQHRASRGPSRTPLDHLIRVAYVNEALEYHVNAQTLEDVTQFEELVALGFDPVTGSGSGQLASLELDLERSLVDAEIDTRQGYTLTLHLEHAAPFLGRGTYRYNEVMAEARAYVPVGPLGVWAGRVRSGSLLADTARDVPFSERYFLGGATSLRGWGRFQVAPLTADGLPVGGRAMFEASTELRFPITGAFGGAVFVDAGDVWNEPGDLQLSSLRASAGPGLRWSSPIGVLRLDLGYQLTPISGLIVDGAPERRRWRIHLSIGEAF